MTFQAVGCAFLTQYAYFKDAFFCTEYMSDTHFEYVGHVGDWSSSLGFIFGIFFGLLYVPYYYDGSEYNGKRSWTWFRKNLRLWKLIHAYFGLKFDYKDEKKLADMMNKGPVMFNMHPHGVWTMSGPYGAGTHAGLVNFEIFMGVTRIVFWIPIYRDLVLWTGGIDASGSTLEAMIKNGKSVGLAPGGVQEIILSNVDKLDLYFEHEGFLKLALENGTPLIPTFCRGENRIFITSDAFRSFRIWCCHVIGYPFPTFFLGPWPVDLRIFVGSPIYPLTLTGERKELSELKREYYTELFTLICNNETNELSDHLKKEMSLIKD
jgi:hypothetical protein